MAITSLRPGRKLASRDLVTGLGIRFFDGHGLWEDQLSVKEMDLALGIMLLAMCQHLLNI